MATPRRLSSTRFASQRSGFSLRKSALSASFSEARQQKKTSQGLCCYKMELSKREWWKTHFLKPLSLENHKKPPKKRCWWRHHHDNNRKNSNWFHLQHKNYEANQQSKENPRKLQHAAADPSRGLSPWRRTKKPRACPKGKSPDC